MSSPSPARMSVRPKKRLGQHFLTDPNTIRRIAAAIDAPPGAPVVEIGPGEGALTAVLLAQHPQLVALEVDPEAIGHLRQQFPSLDVRAGDVLDMDWHELATELGSRQLEAESLDSLTLQSLHVIGNLPYYITSPILFALLAARQHIARAVVMIQREVADRIVAEPSTKAYGTLSVQLQLLARPRFLFPVSRHVFRPKPDVESAVIALDFADVPPLGVDEEALRRVVRTAFGKRRKMMRNTLRELAEEWGGALPDELATRRPESLTPPQFVELTRTLQGKEERGKRT
ncbi:MAG: 16S rRNA (adenine(1518)-N(6)/adenine(1519)-N(6)) -dimethyltransferase RsmA [Rubricoccaceae bacterium]